MADFRRLIVMFLLAIHTHNIVGVLWDRLHCSSDATQEMIEGQEPNIGRFPWLGIVQHTFFIVGKAHYAVTGAVLIHPTFAIAAAEDIAKINADQLVNNTKLILWGTKANKYALEIKDYILHPEYHEQKTYATIALLDLIAWGESQMSEWKAIGTMEKEILKMKHVENQVCEEFYYKNQLTFSKMNPVNPLCAASVFSNQTCVWDAGTALITRQSWGFWKLLGFAVRGPGCGAPTRFLNMHDYLPWINDIISQIPNEDPSNTFKIGVRRVSPIKLVMYSDVTFRKTMTSPGYGGGYMPLTEGGLCLWEHYRLIMLLRENPETRYWAHMVDCSPLSLKETRPVAQQWEHYWLIMLVIATLSEFNCAVIELDVNRQSNAALWLEHNCHKDVHGLHPGHERPMRERMSCFVYFKSSAFLEIRFYFSFKAYIEVSMFGNTRAKAHFPDPFMSSQYTTSWWPTGGRLKFLKFHPENLWANYL